ncbi:MAG: O-antigen ligase family protein [Candidatus Omnitrophica bacterium]|nr:O-antigen ligase family protein [Candidatus Omnitrophota bacterium]
MSQIKLQKITNLIIGFLEKLLLLNFFVFLIYLPYSNKLFPKISLYSGIFLWLLINILKYKQRFYRGFFPPSPLNRYFLFFGFACLFSIILSLDPYHSQAIFFDRFLLFFFFFSMGLGLVSSAKNNLYFLIFAFIISGFIIGLGGVYDYIYSSCMAPGSLDRLWSVFGKRIIYYGFPLYVTYYIPFNFAIFTHARHKFLRIAGFVTFVLLFLCLLCNGSRIGLVAVLVSLLFISFFNLKKKKTILLSLTIIITLISVISIGPLSGNLKWRIKTMFYPSEWSYRLPLYHSAISIFRDYPLIGIGVGMFEKVLHTPKYELPKDYPEPKKSNLHAHNTYLEVSAEMGIVGILTFLLIFITFFIKSIHLIILPKALGSEDERAIFLGLVGTILAILIFAFGTTIITVGFTVSSYFWFLFGMANGLLFRNTKLLTQQKI